MTTLVNDGEVQCNYTVEVPMVELVHVLVKEALKQRQQVFDRDSGVAIHSLS